MDLHTGTESENITYENGFWMSIFNKTVQPGIKNVFWGT